MKIQRRRILAGVVIVAALLLPTLSQADDASEDGARIRAKARAVHDVAITEVIDEIVVLGQRRRRFPGLGRALNFDPVLNGLRRFDWQFFPVYYPEREERKYLWHQFSNEFEETGIVEVFRLRFGH